MECQESIWYNDRYFKNVQTKFLERIIAFSLDCANPVEKDPKCQIQLEKFIFSSLTNVRNDINCHSFRHFWPNSIRAKCTNKLMQQHSTKVAQFLFLYSKAVHFVKEKRILSFLIPTKLHLNFVCMKRVNCKDEARCSLKKIRQGVFVFQQETFLSHRSD